MKFLEDRDFTLYQGDVLETLRALPDESVNCVVTSPPYWGLRDYSADGQLGLEATPEEYIARMVEVFREVRRVLRKDGTCFVNIGDSYISGQGGRQSAVGEMPAAPLQRTNEPRERDDVDTGAWASRDVTAKMTPARGTTDLKPKDLAGIPWMLAFALRADGWYLRSDIIWSKPNPMPESVTDRPTKAHEYVFMLTKSARYWFDQEAVREPAEFGRCEWSDVDAVMASVTGARARGATETARASATVRALRKPPQDETLDGGPGEAPRGPDGRRKTTVQKGDGSIQHRDGERWPNGGRNIRSVWEIATQPYPEAHFATYPEELVRRCVLAGCPEWVCGTCGAARERIVEVVGGVDKTRPHTPKHAKAFADGVFHKGAESSGLSRAGWRQDPPREAITVGWSDCGCSKRFEEDDRAGNYQPGVVLDPFMGSGTTAVVARKHNRRCVGIELNAEYCELAARRTQQLTLEATG